MRAISKTRAFATTNPAFGPGKHSSKSPWLGPFQTLHYVYVTAMVWSAQTNQIWITRKPLNMTMEIYGKPQVNSTSTISSGSSKLFNFKWVRLKSSEWGIWVAPQSIFHNICLVNEYEKSTCYLFGTTKQAAKAEYTKEKWVLRCPSLLESGQFSSIPKYCRTLWTSSNLFEYYIKITLGFRFHPSRRQPIKMPRLLLLLPQENVFASLQTALLTLQISWNNVRGSPFVMFGIG